MDDEVEKGVAMLDRFLDDPGDKKRALDLLEVVTERPGLQREILEEAERRGSGIGKDVEKSRREVEGSCIRCGRDITIGYFLDSGAGELGPFGSTCIERLEG